MEHKGSFPCSHEPSTAPYPKRDQTSPHHLILFPRSILILYFDLCLGITSSLFRSDFPTNNLYEFFSPFMLHNLPTDLPRLHHSNYTWRRSSLCSFPQPPVTSSLLGLNILLSTLFPNTTRDQVSHSNRTTGKVSLIRWIGITNLPSQLHPNVLYCHV
jgi:hypothetical protein